MSGFSCDCWIVLPESRCVCFFLCARPFSAQNSSVYRTPTGPSLPSPPLTAASSTGILYTKQETGAAKETVVVASSGAFRFDAVSHHQSPSSFSSGWFGRVGGGVLLFNLDFDCDAAERDRGPAGGRGGIVKMGVLRPVLYHVCCALFVLPRLFSVLPCF